MVMLDSSIVIAKFGGTSLADAAQFRKVKNIIDADSRRRYVIASAPGKRFKDDIKVTDMLISCHNSESAEDLKQSFQKISERFQGIINELGLDISLENDLGIIQNNIINGASYSYLLSRGEYLNSKLLAAFLGMKFVDASELIFFDANGKLNAHKTYSCIRRRLSDTPRAVIPGFYGTMPDGSINTFPRGGSDITGSVIARGLEACMYENWTDVSGFLMCDPRIVENPKVIDVLTYRELRELSYMGATVLQEEAVFPVRELGIPINVKNTNSPNDKGTIIVSSAQPGDGGTITGIAGRKGYSVFLVEKALMNNQIGFLRKVLSVFEAHSMSVEHIPTGIDTMSVVVDSAQLKKCNVELFMQELRKTVDADQVRYFDSISLIAVAGRNMKNRSGTAGKLLQALGNAGINISIIDQSINEMNIIVGVADKHFNDTIKLLYTIFVDEA